MVETRRRRYLTSCNAQGERSGILGRGEDIIGVWRAGKMGKKRLEIPRPQEKDGPTWYVYCTKPPIIRRCS